MHLRSNPTWPGAKALVGDFAVQQNASNRGYPVTDSAMDGTFGPVHVAWRALWNQQQLVESQVTALCLKRDDALNVLSNSVRAVYRSLQASQGMSSPKLKQYLPGGDLELLQLPCPKLLAQLVAYVPVISTATDDAIPPEIRNTFIAAYAETQTQQAAVDAARQAVTEVQKKRAEQDAGWVLAYRGYHRAVEYEMRGDRKKIQMFIKVWPPPASSTAARAPAEAEESPDPSASKAPNTDPGQAGAAGL